MTSTLTARFVSAEDYLKGFCLPQYSEPKYIEYLDERHPHARGVVMEFGDSVVKHWLEVDAYFTPDDYTGEERQRVLDRIVADKLSSLFASTSSIPVMGFLDL